MVPVSGRPEIMLVPSYSLETASVSTSAWYQLKANIKFVVGALILLTPVFTLVSYFRLEPGFRIILDTKCGR